MGNILVYWVPWSSESLHSEPSILNSQMYLSTVAEDSPVQTVKTKARKGKSFTAVLSELDLLAVHLWICLISWHRTTCGTLGDVSLITIGITVT